MSSLWERFELKRKLKFLGMGAIAVLANFGTNQLLVSFHAPLYVAGPIGFLVGGQVNFFLHNFVTWRDRHPSSEGWQYRWKWFMLGNAIGVIVNTVALLGYTALEFMPVLAFVAALGTSAVFNWFWNDRLSFAHHPFDPPDDNPTISERSDA